jgi:hypothetical protein
MDFQWVSRFFPGPADGATPMRAAKIAPPRAAIPAPGALLYPPTDQGLAIVSPLAILDANQDLIRRLRLHAAVEEPVFAVRFLAPLERIAAFVNVLPATATANFSGEAGQFRACLEMAFYCFQASDGRIFTGQEGVEQRHALEWRWRYLCFLAGLFYPLGRSIERVVVTAEDGAVWKRHFSGVTEWASLEGINRVFVSWGTTDAEVDVMGPASAASALVPHVAGPENLQMLEDGASDLVAALYQLVVGAPGSSRIAHQVISTCWDRVVRREAARRPQAFGRLTMGTHQGPYLIGAIRDLVQTGKWPVNKSCLRADSNGLYLFWPDAAADLIAHGKAKGYAGWPDNAPTIAELLKAAKIVIEGPGDLGCVDLVDDHGQIRAALQFGNPLSVLEDFTPESFGAGITLQAVLKADPLSAAEAKARPNAQPAGFPLTEAKTQQESKGSPMQARQAEVTSSDHPAGEPARAPGAEAPPLGTSKPPKPDATAASEVPAKLKEAADVRFSDLVPEDIRNEIGNPLQSELLGKVVKAWRDRGQNSDVMRRVDQGAAIAMHFLTSHMRDATTWVDVMAKAGLIYAPPQTPGLRIQKVSIPEGRPPVQAIVLSNLACRRLGL